MVCPSQFSPLRSAEQVAAEAACSRPSLMADGALESGGTALSRPASDPALARLVGLARSLLCSFVRRRCVRWALLLGVPTTLLAFLLRTLTSIQASARRKALADIAARRRQTARENIVAEAAKTDVANSAGTQQEVLRLGFAELQKRLRDGKLTAQSVIASYRAQAECVHRRVNCLTELLPEAVQLAEACAPSFLQPLLAAAAFPRFHAPVPVVF